jgi:hypothetical protein
MPTDCPVNEWHGSPGEVAKKKKRESNPPLRRQADTKTAETPGAASVAASASRLAIASNIPCMLRRPVA